MMKSIAAGLLAFGLLLTTPTVASADTPGCATQAEYRRVRDGMTMPAVHRLFDTSGSLTNPGSPLPRREYDHCAGVSTDYVAVWYERARGAWRVTFKFSTLG